MGGGRGREDHQKTEKRLNYGLVGLLCFLLSCYAMLLLLVSDVHTHLRAIENIYMI